MTISLNVRCFREVGGLVVRDATCLHAPEECQELQKTGDFQTPEFPVSVELSGSSTLEPVNRLKPNQRN